MKMDKRPSRRMMTTSAAVFLHFLLLFFSINTSPTSATIKGPPTAERKELKRIVRVGEMLKLQCPMNGSPPMSYDWTKDKEQIRPYAWPRFKTQKKNLKIKPVQIEDTGIYICKGTNGFGSEEIRIDLIVIDPINFPGLEEGQLPDVAPPVLTQETKSHRSAYRKNSGDNFRLTCEALGKPDPEIIWYKNDMEMSHNSGHNIGSSSSGSAGKAVLTIKNLQSSNVGMYTCRARNSEGSVSRNFTLDVIPSKEEAIDIQRIPGSISYDTIHDFANLHEGGLVMPSGPENTTVRQGDKAVLECRVHSTIKSNIMWLKKLEKEEEESYIKNANIIEVGKEKFKILQKKKQSEDEVKVNSRGVEILNTMEIPQSSLQDSGMYICFVKNPSGFKFKSAYLTVIPKSNNPNSNSGDNEAQDSRSILILIVCLAIVVMILFATIITCFLKKRQKKANHSSNTSSSTASENSPELNESLMRQQQQNQHQNFNHNQHYTSSTIHQQQQAMQRNLLQQQQQQPSLYQQPYHQQQQIIYQQQQQQRLQHPSITNNNHRNPMNGQMSIMVNKMADTPLPPAPAPPPPPPSLHNEWNPGSIYNGVGGSVATDSIVDAGVPVVNMYNTNLHHHIQQQQNQYEVPHAHTRFVPGGPSSNEKGGSLFDPGSQRHIYNPRSHY